MKKKLTMWLCIGVMAFTLSADSGKWKELTLSNNQVLSSGDYLVYLPLSNAILVYIEYKKILLRSNDTGKTWATIPLSGIELNNERIQTVAGDAGGKLFVTLSTTVYRLSSGSDTWKKILEFPIKYAYPKIEVGGNGLLLVTAEDSLYRSADAGETWTTTFFGKDGNFKIGADGALYARRFTQNFSYDYLIRSSDNGATWDTIITTKVGIGAGIGWFTIATDSSVYIISDISDLEYILSRYKNGTPLEQKLWPHQRNTQMGVGPDDLCAGDDGLLFLGLDSIYCSRDRGTTWEMVTAFNDQYNNKICHVYGDGKILAVSISKLYIYEPAAAISGQKIHSSPMQSIHCVANEKRLTIDFTGQHFENRIMLSISNCVGREKLHASIRSGKQSASFDLHAFSTGYYVAVLTDHNGHSESFGFVHGK